MPKVALIIVNYNHARFLRDLFSSLARVDYPRESLKIYFFDNASSDGSVTIAREFFAGFDLNSELIENRKNLGFAGGNNECIRQAVAEGFEFAYLLNPDTEVEPDFLSKTLVVMDDPETAAVQSLILLADRTRVNSAGNAFHFLGFSYCLGYRDDVGSLAYQNLKDQTPEIVSASGAAVLFRLSALKEIGLFEELLFAYHEDVEISLRLRFAGWRLRLAPESVVYHKYEFSRSIEKYFWMERNRYIVLIMHFRWRTLLLISPMLKAVEIGMFLLALRSGWWREKLLVYGWFLNPQNFLAVMAARRRVKKTRILPDRAITRTMSTDIAYQEVDNLLLRRLGNPMMRAYWRMIRSMIRW
jgi:GT2 family glycosyltransferase